MEITRERLNFAGWLSIASNHRIPRQDSERHGEFAGYQDGHDHYQYGFILLFILDPEKVVKSEIQFS